jgi:hypothetical protein
MPGGFGGGEWGKGPWGSFSPDPFGPVFLDEALTLFEALSVAHQIQVVSASAVNLFEVLVNFSSPLDLTYVPNLDPGNYDIPGLTVFGVTPTLPNQVLLSTSQQLATVYTVTVSSAKDTAGDFLNPLYASVNFAGFPLPHNFIAAAQSATKIQLIFSVPMQQNAAYTDPASYSLVDLTGTTIPIISTTAIGPSPNQRLEIQTGTDLVPGGYYALTITSPSVLTTLGLSIVPPTSQFRWNEVRGPIQLKISDFTGEVTGGLLGQPLGQVFFSPSLETAAPTSAIQIDDVAVCTKAFDTYTPPSPPDPAPLYTFSSNGPAGAIGGAVLFAPWPRLLGAKLDFEQKATDATSLAVTGPAVAILQQPFDPAYVSLLNNSFWTTFNGSGTPFITANNLAPIPPGPTEVITLEGTPETIAAEGFGGDPWGAENWG